jgi:molybdopterin synthase sulfur carrier subunit|uniref:MoaD/ThiS family protein n=1 Tax=Desulfomonile tiedjei TaxID=2358 RepID=A0A7C4AQ30_9BACT
MSLSRDETLGLCDMIKIKLVLYASLAHLLPAGSTGNSCTVELEEGATVGTLLHKLGIPIDAPKIVFVNGRHAGNDHALAPNDRVAVFPPIAGG